MTCPLVRDLAAEGFPVRLTCGVLGFSAQVFYEWQARPCSDRDYRDAALTDALIDAQGDDPEFGYRSLADEVRAAGVVTGERRVWRLCHQQRLCPTTTRKGRTGKRPGVAVHDDLVNRMFTTRGLDRVWLTNITEHPTLEGELYCCAIKDVYQKRIVGYAIGDRMTARLAVNALRTAVVRRRPIGTVIVYSDRGGQFRSWAFRAVLTANNLTCSMGGVASARDNTAMESFFALLQKNVLKRHRWRTREKLRSEIIYWIEHTYNHRRRQWGLGRLMLMEFEYAFKAADAA